MKTPTQPPIKPNAKLVAIWRKMKPAERDKLAELARTTPGSLRHVVAGRRHASSELAMALETALEDMGLRAIPRGELSPVCARCSYYRHCKLGKKL